MKIPLYYSKMTKDQLANALGIDREKIPRNFSRMNKDQLCDALGFQRENVKNRRIEISLLTANGSVKNYASVTQAAKDLDIFPALLNYYLKTWEKPRKINGTEYKIKQMHKQKFELSYASKTELDASKTELNASKTELDASKTELDASKAQTSKF